MDFNKMSEESLKEMQSQIEEALENKKKRLYLMENVAGDLCIIYGNRSLGFIDPEGGCYILSTAAHRVAYQRWLDDGMPVDDTTVVEWRGGKYRLSCAFTLYRGDINDGRLIYDFEYASPDRNCKDDNIKRYSNGTPILY